ncbi:MAG TPA: PhnD/SsuA/transferrin family substrate-binding protein [Actinomycetota bacterium]|nr:PhnD/SsuA/transferrin family substrate-binding protein [Actinomycetota bacterium]
MADTVLVGAVAYNPNVVPVWEGIRDHFRGSEVECDFVLYSNYERQVDDLIAGQIDIAWNTNLAYVRTVRRVGDRARALAMRDTDVGFRSFLVSRAGSGFHTLRDLRGRRLALGSRDSAQAAILPLFFLRRAGLAEEDIAILRFDSDVGKHGDTGRSELDAIRAVLDDQADAAAIGVTTWDAIGREELAPGALEAFWESPPYAHCNFTVLDALDEERGEAWVRRLLEMRYEQNSEVMDLEGVREWVRPQLEGYAPLFAAVEEQGVA